MRHHTWFLALFVVNAKCNVKTLAWFVPPAKHYGRPRLSIGCHLSAKDLNNHGKKIPIHLVASDDVILPGESTTLSLSDEDSIPLMQNCLDQKSGSLAVGVNLHLPSSSTTSTTTSTDDEVLSMARVASLCDIVGLTVSDNNENRVSVDVKCTGRVRLSELLQQYSDVSYRFLAEKINEPLHDSSNKEEEEYFEKAQLVEENIQLLLKRASKTEIAIRNAQPKLNNSDVKIATRSTSEVYLYNNFIKTKAMVARAIAKDLKRQYGDTQDSSSVSPSFDFEDIQSLVATSWAVFLSLNDDTLKSRYRLRAFDWDNLLERLKLAQYALREKELFLQGQLMLLESSAGGNGGVSDGGDPTVTNDYLDAFQ